MNNLHNSVFSSFNGNVRCEFRVCVSSYHESFEVRQFDGDGNQVLLSDSCHFQSHDECFQDCVRRGEERVELFSEELSFGN